MPDELRLSIEKLIYVVTVWHTRMEIPFSCRMFCPEKRCGQTRNRKRKTDLGGIAGGNVARGSTRKSKVRSFSKMRRLPLPAHPRGRAVEAKERDLRETPFAPRRRLVGWRNCGAFGGTVRLSKPGAMGGKKRNAPGAGIFLTGKLRDRADR